MNSHEFCIWLQGFFDTQDGAAITPRQADAIKKKLESISAEIAPTKPNSTFPPSPSIMRC